MYHAKFACKVVGDITLILDFFHFIIAFWYKEILMNSASLFE